MINMERRYFFYGNDNFPAFYGRWEYPQYFNGKIWVNAPSYADFNDIALEIDESEFFNVIRPKDMPYNEGKAIEFSTEAHKNQLRKDGITPYIEHPRSVVNMLKMWGVENELLISVAWLHDVIEDTDITFDDIRKCFGGNVALQLKYLTHDKAIPKQQYLDNIANGKSEIAKVIKCADRLCNTLDFMKMGVKDKAGQYLSCANAVFKSTANDQNIEQNIKDFIHLSFNRTMEIING